MDQANTECAAGEGSALQRPVRRCKRSPRCKRLRRYNYLTERRIKRIAKPARLLGKGGAWARLFGKRLRQKLRHARKRRSWTPRMMWRTAVRAPNAADTGRR